MQKKYTIRLKPAEASVYESIAAHLAAAEGVKPSEITGFYTLKRSIDARSRQPWVNLTVMASINEPFIDRPHIPFHFHNVSSSDKRVVIIGAGPAGFAGRRFRRRGHLGYRRGRGVLQFLQPHGLYDRHDAQQGISQGRPLGAAAAAL